jgi:hypothetical protein
MEYTTRIVRSSEGLTKEAALMGLQEHPMFKPGTKIANIYNQGGRWVAKLMEPKSAGWGDTVFNAIGDVGASVIDQAGGAVNAIGEANKGINDLVNGDVGGALSHGVGAVGDLAGGATHAVGDLAQAGAGIAGQAGFDGAGEYSQGIQNMVNATGLPGGITDASQANQNLTGQSPDASGTITQTEDNTMSDANKAYLGSKTADLDIEVDENEDIDESPAELHEEMHELSESPLEEEEEHEDSEGKELKEIKKKLDLLLDALGISEDSDSEDLGDLNKKGPADLPATPEGGPKSEPLPPGSGAKLKPGEVPNKPGMTPVGAPAFASVKSRGPVASFVASKTDPSRELTIRQAKASLENEFAARGFRVARIKRDGDNIHAFVTRNDS